MLPQFEPDLYAIPLVGGVALVVFRPWERVKAADVPAPGCLARSGKAG